MTGTATQQEAIELNLARATKSAGLTKDAVGRANMAMKACALLGIDATQLAKVGKISIVFLKWTATY